MELLDEHGSAAGFLTKIKSRCDRKVRSVSPSSPSLGASNLKKCRSPRSKNSLRRLHELSKPARPTPQELHSALTDSDSDSNSDHEGSLSSSVSDIGDGDRHAFLDRGSNSLGSSEIGSDSDTDIESKYETARLKRRPSWERGDENSKAKTELVARLPIKLVDGTIRPTGLRRLERVRAIVAKQFTFATPNRPRGACS